MLLTLASLLNKESEDTFKVSSNGMLVKRDSTSRLAMKSSWVLISNFFSKFKTVFSVYILVVIGPSSGTRNLARLYVGVLIADIIGLKGGQLSTNCL